MPGARQRILLLLGLGLLVLATVATGAADADRHAAKPGLVGFDEYYEPVGDFEATQLVRLDPATLRRLPGRPLKLHDYASSRVLGPDGRTVAIGGYNYGEVILVDLARLARTARFAVAPRLPGNTGVDVLSWPRPDRMLAVVSQTDGPALVSSSLVVIDPRRRRVLRRVLFGREELAPLQVRGGPAVLMVRPLHRVAHALLVVADVDGTTRTVTLKRILAGQGRYPGLASDGHRVFVVGAREPVASVDLRTLAVTYREVPRLMAAHLPITPPAETGSAGPQLAFTREASWLGHGRLLVSGEDEFPAPHLLARWVTHPATIVDTRTWKVQHVFRSIGTLSLADGILLGSGARWVGKRQVGPSLVAFRPDGTLLYRKRQPNLWWHVVGGRLVVGKEDSSRLTELDLRTGRRIRELGRSVGWPFDGVLSWTPPTPGS
jgi:hypothetical protein